MLLKLRKCLNGLSTDDNSALRVIHNRSECNMCAGMIRLIVTIYFYMLRT